MAYSPKIIEMFPFSYGLYPERAGSKGKFETGKNAALAVDRDPERKYETYAKIIKALKQFGCLRRFELADAIGEIRSYCSPRVSELHRENILRDRGLRRINETGKKAVRWTLRDEWK